MSCDQMSCDQMSCDQMPQTRIYIQAYNCPGLLIASAYAADFRFGLAWTRDTRRALNEPLARDRHTPSYKSHDVLSTVAIWPKCLLPGNVP